MTRVFDIFFAISSLIVLSPILLVIVVILRFSGEGKIFFLQERVGQNNDNFKMIKFATMLENSPNMEMGTITLKNDPRILPFGQFLRKTKINELPQLVNIFKGDMSIIGPRPLTKVNFLLYSADIRNIISKVRPGLSGIGSIYFRGEENLLTKNDAIEIYKNKITPFKGELEVWYVNNKNLILYFKLILITFIIVLFPRLNCLEFFVKKLPTPPRELNNLF